MGHEYGFYGAAVALAFYALAIPALVAALFYVLNSVFLGKLLKSAGHRNPVSSWVPGWNFNSFLELGGIRTPWPWTAVVFGGLILGKVIPVLGPVLLFATYAILIVLIVFVARAVQAGLGINSTGGVIFAAILPVFWLIWVAGVAERSSYDRERALAEGSRMPLSWFGESDTRAPFEGSGSKERWEDTTRPEAPTRSAAEAAAEHEQRPDVASTDFPSAPPVPRFGAHQAARTDEAKENREELPEAPRGTGIDN